MVSSIKTAKIVIPGNHFCSVPAFCGPAYLFFHTQAETETHPTMLNQRYYLFTYHCGLNPSGLVNSGGLKSSLCEAQFNIRRIITRDYLLNPTRHKCCWSNWDIGMIVVNNTVNDIPEMFFCLAGRPMQLKLWLLLQGWGVRPSAAFQYRQSIVHRIKYLTWDLAN